MMTHMNRYVSGRGSLHSKRGRSGDRPVKIGKAAGEDEIRPEMLKAFLNSEGI